MLPTGQGGGASHQRGIAFPRPSGRLYGFHRQRRYKKWRRRRRTSPAQRYYITPEGESPQPACKAKPITGRTLAAQGQRPGGWLNPHARKGVSTFGNTGKHRAGPGPDPDRTERRHRLNSPILQGDFSTPLRSGRNDDGPTTHGPDPDRAPRGRVHKKSTTPKGSAFSFYFSFSSSVGAGSFWTKSRVPWISWSFTSSASAAVQYVPSLLVRAA